MAAFGLVNFWFYWGNYECFYIVALFLGSMQLLFEFPQNWVIIFFAFLGVWAVLLFARKKDGRKKEVKEQVYLAGAGLFSLFLMEVFATQSGLWHYIPGDWPVILWPHMLPLFCLVISCYVLLKSGLWRKVWASAKKSLFVGEFASVSFEFLFAFDAAEVVFFSVVSDLIFGCFFV